MLLALALLLGTVTHVGLATKFLPCSLDCGETYENHIGARNLYRFGLRPTMGLQDLAAGTDSRGHPTLYTHNVSLAMYCSYVLFLLGVHDVHAQAGLTALPFLVGVAYLYLFLRAITRDAAFAALGLLTAASLYLLVAMWAFNLLRSWSWVLTFGPLHHLLAFGRHRHPAHLVLATLLMALTIGIDYPFVVFVVTSILGLRLVRLLPLSWPRLLTIVGIGFGVPFILRQVQVMAAVGMDFWMTDVWASVLRRIPLIGLAVGAPDPQGLSAIYLAHKVLKWPGEGDFTPFRWVIRVGLAYTNVLGPPFLLLAGAWLLAVLALRRRVARQAVKVGGRVGVAACYAAVALALGLIATFVVFGEYFMAFYGVLVMPMVVHWAVVVLTVGLYLLLAHRHAAARVGRRVMPVGALVLTAFVLWRVGTEARNYLVLPPRSYPARDVLEDMQGFSMVTFWISSAVSAYTGEWAAVLQDPRWRTIRPGDLPFEPARDYYFFVEADRDNRRYGQPDFLFVPALNVAWLDNRACRPLRGRVNSLADGCSDLGILADRLGWLPLARRGPDYLLYDLRPVYAAAGAPGGNRSH